MTPAMDTDNHLNGAQAMVRMLAVHDVRHIFGLCGDTSLPFYDALYQMDHKIEHILTRDERCAAYMADAYARVTGKVGICEGPSGGGATYILPGLVEAGDSSIPILAITSDVAVTACGHYPLTELDQDRLMQPLTKWNGVIPKSEMLPDMVRQAFRNMTTGRPGSAHLGLPIDVQRGPVDPDLIWADDNHSRYPAYRSGPDMNSIEAALDAILSASNPVIICGGGVVIAKAEAELKKFAHSLNITVATTVSGQGSLSEADENCLGVVGSNGGVAETRAVIDNADMVIFAGCRAGSVTTERWRSPGKSIRIVHIDSDPLTISASYKTEVGIVSDAALAFAALNDLLEKRKSRDFGGKAEIARATEAKWAIFNKLADEDSAPIRPERLIRDLQAILPKDAIIVADPGTPCPYFSAYYRFDEPGRHFISNRAHGALGYSLSAAMGACYGRPDKKVVAVMGDGSFGFTCGELETVVRKKLPITFIVISNSVYGWIKAGQKTGFGERYFSVDFDRTDHAAVAAAFGVKSWRVEDPADLQRILKLASETDGPTLVDVISQPLQDANAPVSEWIA